MPHGIPNFIRRIAIPCDRLRDCPRTRSNRGDDSRCRRHKRRARRIAVRQGHQSGGAVEKRTGAGDQSGGVTPGRGHGAGALYPAILCQRRVPSTCPRRP